MKTAHKITINKDRLLLAPYLGETIRVRAFYCKADSRRVGSGHEKTYLVSKVHLATDKTMLCGHAWLSSSIALREVELRPQDMIEFDAVVRQYVKRYPPHHKNHGAKHLIYSYGLTSVSNLIKITK